MIKVASTNTCMYTYEHIYTVFLYAVIVPELLLLLFVSFISKHNIVHKYTSALVTTGFSSLSPEEQTSGLIYIELGYNVMLILIISSLFQIQVRHS